MSGICGSDHTPQHVSKGEINLVSNKVPARLTIWGDETVIPGTILQHWLPYKWSKETSDPVEIELGRLNESLSGSEDVLRETAYTIYNKPVLYSVSEILDDFASHNEPGQSLIAGFVVPDSVEFISLDNGRIWLSVIAKVCNRYAPKVIEFFKRDGDKKKKVSVEM